MESGGARGGVVVRIDGALRFLPASLATRIAPAPRITAVPGAPPDLLGIAMDEGTIVPVVSIGPLRGQMLVCQHAGESLGLVGGEIVQTGRFEPAPGRSDAVIFDGLVAPALDVSAIYARVQTGGRPTRSSR